MIGPLGLCLLALSIASSTALGKLLISMTFSLSIYFKTFLFEDRKAHAEVLDLDMDRPVPGIYGCLP